MKICILAPKYLPRMGGVEIVTFHMAKGLSRLGHEIHIVTLQEIQDTQKSSDNSAGDYFSNNSFYVHRINLLPRFIMDSSSLVRNIVFTLFTCVIVHKIRPDIVHAQNFIPSIPAYLSKVFFNVPYAICVHAGKFSLTGWGLVLPLCLKKHWPSLPYIKHSSVIFALTDDTRLDVEDCLNKLSITIPNGVDPDIFRHDNPLPVSNHHIPEIVCISRLDRGKGVECALQAMKLIAKRHPSSKLVIVGDGPLKKKMEDLTKNLDIEKNVKFTGKVRNPDVPEYLASANLYLLTSFREGFSISLLEAMASGLPIISTPVGIAPHVINKWNNGYLVPINDHHAIHEAVMKITDNPEIKFMFSKNSAVGAKEYTWNKIVKLYEKEYYKILDHDSKIITDEYKYDL